MIITKTPFRMSFFGGGTDFPDFYRKHGATVLSATIDKYCYVTLRDLPALYPYSSEAVYSKTERVGAVYEIEHPLIREALLWQGLSRVHVAYDADLPARSGLGTSSAFAVGLLHAIHQKRGEDVTRAELAREAIYLERTLCRESGGVQDQIAAAFGGLNRIDFEGEDFTVTPLSLEPMRLQALQASLMLFFTGVSRYSMELQTAHQAALPQKTAELCRMRDMAREGAALLESTASLDDFGVFLHEGWRLKRSITDRITNAYIDDLYDRARAAGAIGGKLLGAGGGGFLLFYVPSERRAAVRKALEGLKEIPFSFENKGTHRLG